MRARDHIVGTGPHGPAGHVRVGTRPRVVVGPDSLADRRRGRAQAHRGRRERAYILYVPASLDRAKPSPLVIYLHGSGITAAQSEQDTQLDLQAEKRHFVVAYAQALRPQSWNWGCCTGAFDNRVDDVAFVREIIQRTTSDVPIDRNSVYLAGLSAGAILAYRIACEAPELIAAVGAISGSLGIANCSPRMAVSILEIHGTNDVQILYTGCSPTTVQCSNRALTSPPTEQLVARFRDVMGCPAPTTQRDGPVTTTKASPCRDGAEVTLMAVEGGQHAQPLGSATGGTLATADIPAVLTFLLAHPRSASR